MMTTIGVPRRTTPAPLTARWRSPSPYTSSAPAGKPTRKPSERLVTVRPIVISRPLPSVSALFRTNAQSPVWNIGLLAEPLGGQFLVGARLPDRRQAAVERRREVVGVGADAETELFAGLV